MGTGAITEYIDVAQLVLYLFWGFFAALILYLRREDKREGYPLDADRPDRIRVQGFPAIPEPKTFVLPHGHGEVEAPNEKADTRYIRAEPELPWPGAPLVPTGDAMKDGVGPASYANREDRPDLTIEGEARIVPMRVADGFFVEPRDPDPRGMEVVGADGERGGVVCDIWVDRSEPQVRYLELEVGDADDGQRALLPITLARVDGGRRQIRVKSITSAQFADVPSLRSPETVTLLEEDKICAYYAGGHLYAMPERQEAVL